MSSYFVDSISLLMFGRNGDRVADPGLRQVVLAIKLPIDDSGLRRHLDINLVRPHGTGGESCEQERHRSRVARDAPGEVTHWRADYRIQLHIGRRNHACGDFRRDRTQAAHINMQYLL
jgi:hypothetical protein